MDTAIYWIGVIHMAGYGFLGALLLADKLVDQIIKSLGLQREFLSFAYERIKARRKKRDLPA
jgi:hypothetical protein